MNRLHARAVARLERLRRAQQDDESGMVMIYVLFVTMMITMLVATVTMASASNVVPAQQSAYDQDALTAAESGVQAYYAALLSHTTCVALTDLAAGSGGCAGLSTGATSGRIAIASANSTHAFTVTNQPYYTWKVLSVGSNFVRVQSTGEIGASTSGLYAKKVVTADITGGLTRNFLDYAYYSTYETLPSSYIQKEFKPGRSIAFDSATTLADAGVTGSPSSVTWSGAPTSGATGSQWCDALYYSPSTGASTVNASTGGLGRYFQGAGLPAGYNWQESVTAAPGASALVGTTHNGICQVDFTTGTTITGFPLNAGRSCCSTLAK